MTREPMHLLIISFSSYHHHHYNLPSQPHKYWNHILSDCPSSISRPLSSRNKVNRPFQEIKGCYRTQESPAQIRQTIQTLHSETKLLETLRIWEKEECLYNVPGLLFCNESGWIFHSGGISIFLREISTSHQYPNISAGQTSDVQFIKNKFGSHHNFKNPSPRQTTYLALSQDNNVLD